MNEYHSEIFMTFPVSSFLNMGHGVGQKFKTSLNIFVTVQQYLVSFRSWNHLLFPAVCFTSRIFQNWMRFNIMEKGIPGHQAIFQSPYWATFETSLSKFLFLPNNWNVLTPCDQSTWIYLSCIKLKSNNLLTRMSWYVLMPRISNKNIVKERKDQISYMMSLLWTSRFPTAVPFIASFQAWAK